MGRLISLPIITQLIGLGIILLILWGLLILTIWFSLRLRKLNQPLKRVILIAFIQVIIVVCTPFIFREAKLNPNIGVGVRMGLAILLGFFILKLILQYSWQQTLRLWGIVAGIQLITLPVCMAIVVMSFVVLLIQIFPPIY
jgi:hypothetical protein